MWSSVLVRSRLRRILFVLGCTLALAVSAGAVTPLPIDPKAKTERALYADSAAWARRVWLAPFRERTASEPWQPAAIALIEEYLAAYAETTLYGGATKLLPEAERVRGLGCSDPLLEFLLIDLRHCVLEDRTITRRALRKLLPALDTLKAPRGLASFAGNYYLSFAHGDERPQTRADLERCVRWQAEAIQDGSYTPDEWHLFVQHFVHFANDWVERDGAGLIAAVEPLKPPEWVDAVLRGHHAVEAAWASRGGDWASKVTPEGRKGFATNLADARRWLTRAWELRPDRPEAAARMITVAMGGGAAPGETEETWLTRSLAAVCDYNGAIRAYALALMPRWGGRHAQMLDFAERCLATGRFDTRLPAAASAVADEMARDLTAPGEFYREPRLKTLILAMSRGFAEEPARLRERGFRRSFLAVNAWLWGESALAHETFAGLDEPLDPRAVARLRTALADEHFVRGELAVAATPGAVAFRKSVAARNRGELGEALKLTQEAIAAAGEDKVAYEFLQGWLAVLATEQTLAGGEWVEYPTTPALHGWLGRAGTWRVGAKGLPEGVGDDRPARSIFIARLGPDFELRAEIAASEGVKPSETPVGVYFGQEFLDDNSELWHACNLFFDDKRNQLFGSYFFQDAPAKVPEVPATPAARYVFEIQVRSGRLSWKLNGQPMHEDVPLAREIGPRARVGIGSFFSSAGFTMTLERLAVRRLAKPGSTKTK